MGKLLGFIAIILLWLAATAAVAVAAGYLAHLGWSYR